MNTIDEKITVYNLFDRNTIAHLRLPFSFYLLPVFCLGLSQAGTVNLHNTIVLFFALHLFVYPASNVYNSYMDKDTGSIGGLKNPPPVTKRLYYASIIFDIAGLGLCAFIGWQYVLLVTFYVAFSKAYSWEEIRLKKHAWAGWLTIAFFQGGYTYMIVNMAAQSQCDATWFTAKHLECMCIASLLIGGSYPLTQVYQHNEDSKRGDYTISYRLGVRGTFVFTSLFFAAGAVLAFYYFTTWYSLSEFIIFIACLSPVAAYFAYWFFITMKSKSQADFAHAMLMNKISSFCMIACFVIIFCINAIPIK